MQERAYLQLQAAQQVVSMAPPESLAAAQAAYAHLYYAYQTQFPQQPAQQPAQQPLLQPAAATAA